MKIALIGYGKMGHMLEEVAQSRGHEIVLRITSSNLYLLNEEHLQRADVAIEFTRPDAAVQNIMLCLKAGLPVVVGTTGWQMHLEEMKKKCFEHDGSLVHASNFSVGVNMVFALNEMLAKWMNRFPEYSPSVEEVHHTQKLDAPSGTAITLADGIMRHVHRLRQWLKLKKGQEAPKEKEILPVFYSRVEGVPGVHKVNYSSVIDRIELTHEAFSRKGFALGAVLAAEFIKDKKGVFTAREIFKFES